MIHILGYKLNIIKFWCHNSVFCDPLCTIIPAKILGIAGDLSSRDMFAVLK